MKKRDFEVAKGFEDKEIQLPVRSTARSAGYDFQSAQDVVIPSIWKRIFYKLSLRYNYKNGDALTDCVEDGEAQSLLKPTMVATGVKAYMGEDEVLQIHCRSSSVLKRLLIMPHVGIIDSDYYNNPKNDGHIMFNFINLGIKDVTIKKGERIGQGVFSVFLKTDSDNATGTRTGGFGSTGE